MFRLPETNPHFLPRHNDPIIEFPPQPSRQRSRDPLNHPRRTSIVPPRNPRPHPHPSFIEPPQQSRPHQMPIEPPHQSRPHQMSIGPPQQSHSRLTSIEPPQYSRPHPPPHSSQTSIEPPHGPRPHPPPHHQVKFPDDSRDHGSDRSHHHHDSSLLRGPSSQRTQPMAWMVAAFCAVFWMIVIIGGLIILIIYLVYRPRNPRFDISATTLNTAYLDMGYLLNADVTLLANFTNPNTKVSIDFTSIMMELYLERQLVATRYIRPFPVLRGESMLANVHLVASQVRFSMEHSQELQRQIQSGRVRFEIAGKFKTTSRLGGIFQYTYNLYSHCQIIVNVPPTGVMTWKRCITKR